MKIFIPSKGRSQTITTHTWLDSDSVSYNIVLHNEQEKADYLKNKSIDPKRIIVSGMPFGLPIQRQWIVEHLCNPMEWVIFLDDNISGFTRAQDDYYDKDYLGKKDSLDFENKKFRQILSHEITPREFLHLCLEMMEIGDRNRAFLCGFATTDNPYFRLHKFKFYGYVIGKALLRKKTIIKYPVNWFCQEDYHDMAEHLLHFGKVLINNFVRPTSKHYQEGGIGNYDSRLPHKIELNRKLLYKYPGLFRYNKKVGCPLEAEIILRLNTETQIEKWRLWMKKNDNFRVKA